MRTRQAVAIGALIVVVVLIAVGVNSCQSSARKSALQDYANNVNSVVSTSNQTGATLFKILQSGLSSAQATSISNQINQTRLGAQNELTRARRFGVPSSARSASSNLLQTLKLRLDGLTNIAAEIQPALGTSVNRDAVRQIAAEMARFYASDVLYKDYVAPEIVSALHANAIGVGGTNGVRINDRQFLPSIQWLDPSSVATVFNVSLPGATARSGKASPGLHGHTLNSVSVNGTTLQSGATNSVTASPPPTFSLAFDNGGVHDETDVTCKVSVTGTSVTGTKIVPQTFAGKAATCAVTLSSTPQVGTYSVVATIAKVPGETNTSNNTLTFPVTFK